MSLCLQAYTINAQREAEVTDETIAILHHRKTQSTRSWISTRRCWLKVNRSQKNLSRWDIYYYSCNSENLNAAINQWSVTAKIPSCSFLAQTWKTQVNQIKNKIISKSKWSLLHGIKKLRNYTNKIQLSQVHKFSLFSFYVWSAHKSVKYRRCAKLNRPNQLQSSLAHAFFFFVSL